MKLKGKRAIVTGASRGLGAAIAAAFGREGAEVFKPSSVDFNFRQPSSAFAMMDRYAELYCGDKVDILVNCAGTTGPIDSAIDVCWIEWNRCLQVNLIAPAELSRIAAESMCRYGIRGSIINISGGGATSPRPNYSAYATAKCGLVRFSETLAAEVEQYGIRVNCVAPGLLNTRMGSPDGDPPDRAAELVTWLASDDSRPITGRLISAKWDPWYVEEFNFKEYCVKNPDAYTLRRVDPLAHISPKGNRKAL